MILKTGTLTLDKVELQKANGLIGANVAKGYKPLGRLDDFNDNVVLCDNETINRIDVFAEVGTTDGDAISVYSKGDTCAVIFNNGLVKYSFEGTVAKIGYAKKRNFNETTKVETITDVIYVQLTPANEVTIA